MKTRMESDSILEKFEVDKFETFFNFLPFKTNVKYLKIKTWEKKDNSSLHLNKNSQYYTRRSPTLRWNE
jgi:hypothetical protein